MGTCATRSPPMLYLEHRDGEHERGRMRSGASSSTCARDVEDRVRSIGVLCSETQREVLLVRLAAIAGVFCIHIPQTFENKSRWPAIAPPAREPRLHVEKTHIALKKGYGALAVSPVINVIYQRYIINVIKAYPLKQVPLSPPLPHRSPCLVGAGGRPVLPSCLFPLSARTWADGVLVPCRAPSP